MKVIINADDFGIDFDRDFGIFLAALFGLVSSVSVIVTNKISCFQKIMISIMKRKISVGLHVNLTDNPLTMFNTDDLYIHKYNFVKPKYIFWKNCLENSILLENIELEIASQFNIFVNKFGFIPNHIDGHNHCNIFNKQINDIFTDYAKKYNIHLRIPYENITKYDKTIISDNTLFNDFVFFKCKKNFSLNDVLKNYELFFKYDFVLYNCLCDIYCLKDNIKFIGSIYGYFRKSKVLYQQIIKFNKDECVQIMVHPGFYFPFMKHKTLFSNFDRVKEFLVLWRFNIYISKDKKINIVNYNYKKIEN